MCLALAEDPKLLLRGTRLDEFIKYGESRAIVDVCRKKSNSHYSFVYVEIEKIL